MAPTKKPKTFAAEVITTEIQELRKYKDMLKKGTEVGEILPEKITENVSRKTIIYKTYSVKNKIDRIQEEMVEKCLKHIWRDVEYITRGGKTRNSIGDNNGRKIFKYTPQKH